MPYPRMIKIESVAFIFGAVTMASGIVGVPLGMFLSTKLKVMQIQFHTFKYDRQIQGLILCSTFSVRNFLIEFYKFVFLEIHTIKWVLKTNINTPL